MILKRDLLDGIDANTEQIILQGQLITELKARIKKLEKEVFAKNTAQVKQVDRPKKVCDKKEAQPRTKDGKFAKKK